MSTASTTLSTPPAHKGTRICVGCGARVDRRDAARVDAGRVLVRICFVDDGDGARAVVDPGGAGGRGAWTHPTPRCLAEAVRRGLSRSAKRAVAANVAELSRQVHQHAKRRLDSLLATAVRSRKAVVGTSAVAEAWRGSPASPGSPLGLLVVASDAAARVLAEPAIAACVQRGQALVYGDKAGLGQLCGRREVAVIGVVDEDMANGVRQAIAALHVGSTANTGSREGLTDIPGAGPHGAGQPPEAV